MQFFVVDIAAGIAAEFAAEVVLDEFDSKRIEDELQELGLEQFAELEEIVDIAAKGTDSALDNIVEGDFAGDIVEDIVEDIEEGIGTVEEVGEFNENLKLFETSFLNLSFFS